ncbi:hypothetical protein [Salinispora arenicola]|nr:hypothetical protein [Salinispora arenicola]
MHSPAAALKVLAELVDAAAGLFGGAVSADSEPSMTGRRWQSMQTG